MADLQAKAILSAEDRASAVLAMVSRNFDRLSRAADQLHARDTRVAQVGAMNAALERRAAILSRLGNGISTGIGMLPGVAVGGGMMAGAAALATAAVAARKAYAENERTFTRIGITGDATREQQDQAALEVDRLAARTKLAQKDVREGLDSLVAAGRSLPEAMAFLPSVAATAQAAGAEVKDIATAADAAGNHLGITAKDMQSAFDIMAAGGKAGKFELKDMARYLAEIAPMAKQAGMQGTGGLADLVSAFQMVRKESGTSEEAATNLKNVFSKMYSEETGNKFEKAGINLRKQLDAAEAKGENLLETFVKITAEATRSGKVKLAELFQDMQAQQGMRALLNNMTEWKRLSGEIASSSNGTVLKDLGRVLKDTQAGFDGLSISAGRLWRNLGASTLVSVPVSTAMETVANQINKLNDSLERSEVIARKLKNDPSVSGPVKTRAEREAEELAYINNLDMNASRARSRKAEYGGDYTVQKGKNGYELVPKAKPKQSLHDQVTEAFNAREQYNLRLKQQQDAQKVLDHRARMALKVRDAALIDGEDRDLEFPNLLNDQNSTAGPYKWSQLLEDEKAYRQAKREGAGTRGAGGTWSAHNEAIDGLISRMTPLMQRLQELESRGADRGPRAEFEMSQIVSKLRPMLEEMLIHKAKRDHSDMPSSGEIDGILNTLKTEGIRAEVKPDQITAKIDGRVETVTTVKVEASPNFVTSIVSQVKNALGPIFEGIGDGRSNP